MIAAVSCRDDQIGARRMTLLALLPFVITDCLPRPRALLVEDHEPVPRAWHVIPGYQRCSPTLSNSGGPPRCRTPARRCQNPIPDTAAECARCPRISHSPGAG